MRTGRTLRLAAAFALAAPLAARACAGLELVAPWIREPPPGADVAAAYGTLRNTGSAPLRVDRVAAEGFGMAMVHETVREGDRVAMRHREGLTVPPHGELALAPGGLHVMLMHPANPPKAGDETVMTFGCGDAEHRWRVPVRSSEP